MSRLFGSLAGAMSRYALAGEDDNIDTDKRIDPPAEQPADAPENQAQTADPAQSTAAPADTPEEPQVEDPTTKPRPKEVGLFVDTVAEQNVEIQKTEDEPDASAT